VKNDVFHRIKKKRRAGKKHLGLSKHSQLAKVLAHFQLRPDASNLRAIDANEARLILERLLGESLAYGTRQMSPDEAAQTAREVVDLIESASFFTNIQGRSWSPMTDATFDAGLIGVGEESSLCVWFEEED
jgi:hypothetical protein